MVEQQVATGVSMQADCESKSSAIASRRSVSGPNSHKYFHQVLVENRPWFEVKLRPGIGKPRQEVNSTLSHTVNNTNTHSWP